jgi:carboxyl-terminal processing protease
MTVKRTLLAALISAGLALVALSSFGTRVRAASTPDDLDSGVRSVAGVFALVEQNYADPVSADRAFYEGAIPGMLGTLDPHSNFLNPAEYADMQRKQRAQYFGVGMLIGVDGDYVVAMEPFPGSPAAQAGLRRGDLIAEVDGKNVKGMKSELVADLLRGPRGTQVRIAVKREGVPEPLVLVVTRGEILTNNQVDAYWLKPGIAYLGIETFEAQNIGSEVESQLKQLGEQSITGMVLDLRGNPGGLVTEAVKVVGRFLRDGQVVVSDRGRSAPEQILRAKAAPLAQNYPIVTLVDRSSASASEIVSGALQDHDRAWILGDTTFGKGLVQAQFPLSEDSALLLTIAHYYTPSGRLIQRDYQHRSFYEYVTRRGEQPVQTEVKSTDSGRKVFGGGGITPDEKYVFPAVNQFQRRVAASGAIFHFGSVYFGADQPKLPSRTWSPDANTFERFQAYLKSKQVAFTDEEFAANRKWVGDLLRRELLMRAFDSKTSVRAVIQDDPEVLKAIESLPKAQALLSSRGPSQRAALK